MQGADIQAIHIVGHTDAIGAAAYNEQLSLKRANAVRDYLVTKGVDSSKIDTQGVGKRDAVGKTAAERAKDRFVDVQVEGTKTIVR